MIVDARALLIDVSVLVSTLIVIGCIGLLFLRRHMTAHAKNSGDGDGLVVARADTKRAVIVGLVGVAGLVIVTITVAFPDMLPRDGRMLVTTSCIFYMLLAALLWTINEFVEMWRLNGNKE